ncbi:MAG: molybdopterin oxidoreductase family protein, partial [Terriglobia bacterium]
IRNNEIQRGNNRDRSGSNGDFLCLKGRYGGDFVHHPERLRQPLLRRNGRLEPATWEDALTFVADRLREITRQHGPESVGFLGSNRTTNEENYLLQRFARAVVGTPHVDHHRTGDYAALVAALRGEASRFAASSDITRARALLLIGNDPTHNHPLLAYNIRSAVRLREAPFYVINHRWIKLKRQAAQFVEVPPGKEGTGVDCLRGAANDFDTALRKQLGQLKKALEKEPDAIILFGAELHGDAIKHLVEWGNSLPGKARYIALGDYANSRGAADLGVLPDRLPGYGSCADGVTRKKWEELWQSSPLPGAGLDARQMFASEKLRALYVVGANPVKTFGLTAAREALGARDLLVVHELFLTETARLADVVLPVASAYEKEGTFTNTCGEVQRLRRALEPASVRTDFEILRLLSYALEKPLPLRTPEAALEEIRQHVPGYRVSLASLLSGQPAMTAPADGVAPAATPAGLVFSSDDSLFTSGTLGRYSQALNSVAERHRPRTEL